MPEPDPVVQLDQARGLGCSGRSGPDAEPLGSAPQQLDVADRFGDRGQQQSTRLRREGRRLAEEPLLQPLDEGRRAVAGLAPEGQVGRREPSR